VTNEAHSAKCIVCAGPLSRIRPYVFASRAFRKVYRDRSIFVCGACGLPQANMALVDGAALTAYYRHVYRAVAGIARSDDPMANTVLLARGAALADLLARHGGGRKAARIFEAGAGYGLNLLAIAGRFPAAALLTDELDATIARPAGIGHATLADGPFDAIVLSHVLEHFRDPLDALTRAAAALVPEGCLVVEVPNDRADRVGYQGHDEPHLTFFDAASLRALAARVPSLEMLELFTAGPPPPMMGPAERLRLRLRKSLRRLADRIPVLRERLRQRRLARRPARPPDFTAPSPGGSYLRALLRRRS